MLFRASTNVPSVVAQCRSTTKAVVRFVLSLSAKLRFARTDPAAYSLA
jgi:hypothetical protein